MMPVLDLLSSFRDCTLTCRCNWGRQPNAIYFVAERRKPSGITMRNTSDSPGGSRRSATNQPSVGPKVDGIGRKPPG